MEDGTKQNFAKELLKHEIRVLMTRGVMACTYMHAMTS